MLNRGIPSVRTTAAHSVASKRSRRWHLISVLLLSSSMTVWAAPTVSAPPRAPRPVELLHEAQRLVDEGSLASAEVAARAALDAGRHSGGLDFTELDAGPLLVDVLHKQAKYDEARRAAEEQITYWDQQSAAAGMSDRPDSRSTSMLGRAIEASMMAGEKAQVTRLQEKLFSAAIPDPALWRLLPDEPRVRYELADFSMPLVLGQWKLTKFEPAQKRDFVTRTLYTQQLTGSRLNAEISLFYDETLRKVTSAQRLEALESYKQRHSITELEAAMPDLPFQGMTTFKRGGPSECDGKECINVHWLAERGDWRLNIDVTFGAEEEAQATEQLHLLFAALKWDSAPTLFRERPMAQQIRDIESAASLPDGVAKAAALAQQSLPDAHFADEIARLQTYIGMAQYQRANLQAARHALDLALPAWEQAFSAEILYENALDYAADIAYRQGRRERAVALNRKLVEWLRSEARLSWKVAKDEDALVSMDYGMRLPLRVGDYRMRPGSEGRFFYENLQTGAQLGLTPKMPQSSDEELEATLRAFMLKTLGLQAAAIHKAKFAPKSAGREGAGATGRKWEFEVTPVLEDQDASREDPVAGIARKEPTKMMFWIVDRGERTSMLRAPLTDSGRSRIEAEMVAQALSW